MANVAIPRVSRRRKLHSAFGFSFSPVRFGPYRAAKLVVVAAACVQAAEARPYPCGFRRQRRIGLQPAARVCSTLSSVSPLPVPEPLERDHLPISLAEASCSALHPGPDVPGTRSRAFKLPRCSYSVPPPQKRTSPTAPCPLPPARFFFSKKTQSEEYSEIIRRLFGDYFFVLFNFWRRAEVKTMPDL